MSVLPPAAPASDAGTPPLLSHSRPARPPVRPHHATSATSSSATPLFQLLRHSAPRWAISPSCQSDRTGRRTGKAQRGSPPSPPRPPPGPLLLPLLPVDTTRSGSPLATRFLSRPCALLFTHISNAHVRETSIYTLANLVTAQGSPLLMRRLFFFRGGGDGWGGDLCNRTDKKTSTAMLGGLGTLTMVTVARKRRVLRPGLAAPIDRPNRRPATKPHFQVPKRGTLSLLQNRTHPPS